MSWHALLEIVRAEADPVAAARIEQRAREELGGLRITVGAKPPLTREQVEALAPGRPRHAAKLLGVSESTVYRALQRPHIR